MSHDPLLKERSSPSSNLLKASEGARSQNSGPQNAAHQIRQSFSHGRSHVVTVEVKKKRGRASLSANLESEAAASSSIDGQHLTPEEHSARLKALHQAKLTEIETAASDEAVKAENIIEALPLPETQVSGTMLPEENLVEKHPTHPQDEKHPQPETSPRNISSSPPTPSQASGKPRQGYVKGKNFNKDTPTPRRPRPQLSRLRPSSLQESDEEGARSFSRRPRAKHKAKVSSLVKEVRIPDTITLQDLAHRMATPAPAVVRLAERLTGDKLRAETLIEHDIATLIVEELGHKAIHYIDDQALEAQLIQEDPPESLKQRPPIITIMGHVNHGKTSLLDALRQTSVAASEVGGITQHIGAYQVIHPSGGVLTFLDTPGHAAFNAMRARGAHVTDIVVLVVAADDGIQEQTVEAIQHAKDAGSAIVVAINKIDKHGANPERLRQALLQHGVILEEFGGSTLCVEVSAKAKLNLELLESNLLLQADLLNLQANPDRTADGIILETQVQKGKGVVGTVLVQNGTLKVGDVFACGTHWGRVRALLDAQGRRLESAPPSTPTVVLGFTMPPQSGDRFTVFKNEQDAIQIATLREQQQKKELLASTSAALLEPRELSQLMAGEQKELLLVLKADTQGSLGALVSSLEALSSPEVNLRLLHKGLGDITEQDFWLAHNAKARIVGFNVSSQPKAKALTQRHGMATPCFDVIYTLIDHVSEQLSELLPPDIKEKILGQATVMKVFNIPSSGVIAGCFVNEGTLWRNSKMRVLRQGEILHEGSIKSLRRNKDDKESVRERQECGIALDRFDKFAEGDILVCFTLEEIKRTLS